EALDDAGFDGCAGAGERLEDGAAGWGDEAYEPAHQRQGFDRRMRCAVDGYALGGVSLRGVHEARRAARAAVSRSNGAVASDAAGILGPPLSSADLTDAAGQRPALLVQRRRLRLV